MATPREVIDELEDEVKPEPRRRLQLDFSEEAYRRLLRIRKAAEASSNAEVVRDALRVYEWLLEQQASGWSVLLAQGDRLREVELFFGPIPTLNKEEIKKTIRTQSR